MDFPNLTHVVFVFTIWKEQPTMYCGIVWGQVLRWISQLSPTTLQVKLVFLCTGPGYFAREWLKNMAWERLGQVFAAQLTHTQLELHVRGTMCDDAWHHHIPYHGAHYIVSTSLEGAGMDSKLVTSEVKDTLLTSHRK